MTATDREQEKSPIPVPPTLGTVFLINSHYSEEKDIERDFFEMVEMTECKKVLAPETIENSSSAGKVFGEDGMTFCMDPKGLKTSYF